MAELSARRLVTVTSVMSLLLSGVRGFWGRSGPLLVERVGGCPTPTARQVTRRERHFNFYGTGTTSANGRGELAANEHAEARVIDEYLPTPLTDAELADVADTAMAQVAEELGERPGMKQMGMVMKAATALAAGKADGARLSAAVKDRL